MYVRLVGSERRGTGVQLQSIVKDFIPGSPMGSVKAVPEAVRQLSSLANLHLAFHGTALTPTALLMNTQLLEQAQLARITTRKLTFHLLTSAFECFPWVHLGLTKAIH